MTERVVITGANRGLGLELTRQHSERGDEVWAGCRRPDDAAELRDLTAHVEQVDMASEESIEAVRRLLSAPRRSTSSTTTPASTPGPSGSTTAPVTCCS